MSSIIYSYTSDVSIDDIRGGIVFQSNVEGRIGNHDLGGNAVSESLTFGVSVTVILS